MHTDQGNQAIPPYTIEAIPAFSDNYIWSISHTTTGKTYVVDPGDAAPVLNHLKKHHLQLAGILITHHHFDHTGGIDALLAATDNNLPVYGPVNPAISQITHRLHDGDSITVDAIGLTFTVFEVPGHTLDHIAYYSNSHEKDKILFCGDTLFSGGCGRLFEGSPKQMLASLNTFKQLPSETKVYCTHEYTLANLAFASAVEPENKAIAAAVSDCESKRQADKITLPSTIAKEKEINPFMRTDQPMVQAQAKQRETALNDQSEEHEIFATIRAWKDNF